MKKIILATLALVLSLSIAYSQPVVNTGVIPIGVTLNSILRLNIVSGGNIEFVVSSISQYESGIANTPIYDTRFTVASSIDFNVRMYAETNGLYPQGNAGALPAEIMPLSNIGYLIESNGGGVVGTAWGLISAGGITLLTSAAATKIIAGISGNAAGGVAKNDFTINWELATLVIGSDMVTTFGPSTTLLSQSLASDRYVVNIFLVLESM